MIRRAIPFAALALAACGGTTNDSGSTGDGQVTQELAEATWYFGNHSAAGFGDEEWWDFSEQSAQVAGRFRHYVSVGEVSEKNEQSVGEFELSTHRQVELTWAQPLGGVERLWFTAASYDTRTLWNGNSQDGLWLSTQAYVPTGAGSYRSRYGSVQDGQFESTQLTLTVSPALRSISKTTACSLSLSFVGSVGQEKLDESGSAQLSYQATCTPRGERYIDIRATELTISEWYETAKGAAKQTPDAVAALFGRVYADSLQYDRSRNIVFNTSSEHARESSSK